MKRFLLAGLLILVSSVGFAYEAYRSSATATTDTTQVLCGGGKRGYLYSVCTSSAVAGTGLTVYNSSFTTAVQNTGFISSGAVGCQEYRAVYTKGIMYSKGGPSNVLIQYDCY